MIGTLFYYAGLDGHSLEPWRKKTLRTKKAVAPISTVVAITTNFFTPAQFHYSVLKRIPWLAISLLIRGAVTLIVGQGASAKTAFAIMVAVAMAAGRTGIGPFTFEYRPDGLPLRVAFISAEEGLNALNLLVASAALLLNLSGPEITLVSQNLILHDARGSGWRAARGANGLDDLVRELATTRIDVLMLDTVASVLAIENENDNALVTRALTDLGRLAENNDLAIVLLHHTPKQNRESAAGQRGEVTLARGGGSFANSARIVLSITSIPASEAGRFIALGMKPETLRRLEHAKINDRMPMPPEYFEVTGVDVTINDGTLQNIRAVEFVQVPALSSAGAGTAAQRNSVMQAVHLGLSDACGARVPLSPLGSGGRTNNRSAVFVVARALIQADPTMVKTYAEPLAKELLKVMHDQIGCIVTQDIKTSKYKPNGRANGLKNVKGLACDWSRATWPGAAPPPAQTGGTSTSLPQVVPAQAGQTSATASSNPSNASVLHSGGP